MQLSHKAAKHLASSFSITELTNLCKDGKLDRAIQIVELMDERQLPISGGVFMCLLQGCCTQRDCLSGKRVYKLMVQSGLGSNAYLCDHLIRLFSLGENLVDATIVFEGVRRPTVYTWNAIISASIKLGRSKNALALYRKMKEENTKPTKVTFLFLLKACAKVENGEDGRWLHGQIVSDGLDCDVAIASTLIDMYCKCGNMEDGVKVFDGLSHHRNAVSWGALISGHVHCGLAFLALEISERMEFEDLEPDSHTISCILKACGMTFSFQKGKIVHNDIIKRGLMSDLVIQNTLLDMYAKCGGLKEAHKVFNGMQNRSSVSWGTMISAYVHYDHCLLALALFAQMQKEGVMVNNTVFTCTLKACGMIKHVDLGMLLHQQIVESSCESAVTVGNALIDMYAKCSHLEEAYQIFIALPVRNIVSWSAIILGYAQQGFDLCAIAQFDKMLQQGMVPDKVMFLCIMKACKPSTFMNLGWGIHDQIFRNSFDADDEIRSTLVSMYVTCERIEEARKVFDGSVIQDVVLWSIMIDGYVEQGLELSALELFSKMQAARIKADKFIFTCTLKACISIGALLQGRLVHDLLLRNELEGDVVVGSSLIDMYTSCGSVEEAYNIFVMLPKRNEVSWGVLISGYAQQGNCMKAIQCLDEMQQEGSMPNEVVFTSVLAACSRVGLLMEGVLFFTLMQRNYDVAPCVPHYSCVIDLLSRAGHVSEAKDLLKTMPMSPDSFTWTSLISGCKTYSHVEVGHQCFSELVCVDPMEASGYVVMSDIFAAAQMWDDVNEVQELKYHTGVHKKAGMSWIELNDGMHEFIVGEAKHVKCGEIVPKVERLNMLVKEVGYMPKLDLIVKCLET